MRLGLDHHYSRRIAERLREMGHDVVAAVEVGWDTLDDHELLTRCRDEGRSLLTNNVADFTMIAREWQEAGQEHFGLVFTSDTSMPRTMENIGRYVELLDELLRRHPGHQALADQIEWLSDGP